MTSLTERQVFGALANALKAHDLDAVRDLLAYAAPRWPDRTQQWMDTARTALAIAASSDRSKIVADLRAAADAIEARP